MRHSNGFTLVELLIVIAITGILATVLVPNLVLAKNMSKDVAAQSYLRDSLAIQEIYYLNNKVYASDENDLLNLGMKSAPSDVLFKIVAADVDGFCMTSERVSGSGKTFFVTLSGGFRNSNDATVCTTAN